MLAIAFGLSGGFGIGNGGSTVAVSPPTTAGTTVPAGSATTAPTLASAKGKPCVGLKDPLPKGSPAFLIAPGPAPTTLTSQDLKVGTGAVVAKKAKVTVNYVGVACSTGKIFDSSYSHQQTFDADLGGGIIPGWQEGVPGMRIGGVRLLGIPSALGYGAAGSGTTIAPDEALYFLIAAVKLG